MNKKEKTQSCTECIRIGFISTDVKMVEGKSIKSLSAIKKNVIGLNNLIVK